MKRYDDMTRKELLCSICQDLLDGYDDGTEIKIRMCDQDHYDYPVTIQSYTGENEDIYDPELIDKIARTILEYYRV